MCPSDASTCMLIKYTRDLYCLMATSMQAWTALVATLSQDKNFVSGDQRKKLRLNSFLSLCPTVLVGMLCQYVLCSHFCVLLFNTSNIIFWIWEICWADSFCLCSFFLWFHFEQVYSHFHFSHFVACFCFDVVGLLFRFHLIQFHNSTHIFVLPFFHESFTILYYIGTFSASNKESNDWRVF